MIGCKMYHHIDNPREKDFHQRFYADTWGSGSSFKMDSKDGGKTWRYECPTTQREFERYRINIIQSHLQFFNEECDNSKWETHLDVDPDAPEESTSWEDEE